MPYQELGPFILTTLSTSQRLALTQFPGLTVRDGNLGMIMVSDGFTWSGYITKTQLPDMFDCVIDDGYQGVLDTVYPTIAEALADTPNGRVSIFVRSAGDIDPVTIASTDSVQRIQGKDADTTELPVSVTNTAKDDVTWEQLKIGSGITLALGSGGSGARQIVNSCLITGTGVLSFASQFGLVLDTRCLSCSTTPLVIGNDGVRVTRILMRSLTGTNGISIDGDWVVLNDVWIADADCSGYVIASTGSGDRAGLEITGVVLVDSAANGGINIGIHEGRIANCYLRTGVAITGRMLRVTSTQDINTVIANNTLIGSAASDVLFECASADANADGLILLGNTFRTGTILGSQNAMWIGNNMAGCTINFQSKTGIVVLGGDLTGVTLQNIPTDIVFDRVKGQDDRGHYTPLDTAVDLGTPTKRFRDAYLSGEVKGGQVFTRIADLKANDFDAVVGAPDNALRGSGSSTRFKAWALDPAATESIGGVVFEIPQSLSTDGTLDFDIICAMSGNGAAGEDVMNQIHYAILSAGDQGDEANINTSAPVTSVATKVLEEIYVIRISPGTVFAAGDRVRVSVSRLGANASDDHPLVQWILGLKIYAYLTK